MKRFDRRRFMLLSSMGAASTVLVACGNDPDDVELNPTMIPDVAGAPPTLAPQASPGAAAGAPAEEADSGGDSAAEVISLEAQDPANWSVKELEAAPGQVIEATNVGFLEHNFTVDELSIAEDLPNGEPVQITVPDDAPVGDTYDFYCSVPGHREQGMVGTLTIIEAAAPAGEGAPSGEGGAEASPAAGEASPAAEAEPAPEDSAAAGGDAPVALEAQDPYAWSINEITAAPGQVIEVTNAGFLEHNFTVDELSIAEDLPSGEPVQVTIPDNAEPGDYEFYCSVPGHREGGMVGTLTIG